MTSQSLPSPFVPAPLAHAVRNAARGSELYVVGGYVRDRLLGRPARDLDIAVPADARGLATRLARTLDAHVFPLSAERGVWRVTLPEPVGDVHDVDVVELRGDLDADLSLRDFTINAIATGLEGDPVHDPHGAAVDLAEGRLRLVSDGAIVDDPLRALRAVRFAVELGMTLDPASAGVIRRDAALLARSAGERQRDELMRALDTPRGADAVRMLEDLGLLTVLIPELDAAKGFPQPKEHYWDVFEHSVQTVAILDCLCADAELGRDCEARRAVLWALWPDAGALMQRWSEEIGEGRSRRALLKLIGLLHDVSKPETRSVEADGRVRFFGHPERGAVVTAEVVRRLRFTVREIRLAEMLIADHLRPGQLAAPGEVPTARALYRLYRDFGDDLPDLLTLNLADGAAAAGPRQTPEQWRAHVGYTAWLLRQPAERAALVRPPRLVTGHDLMQELALEPGPALGRVLEALTEAQAAGEVTTRDQALELARTLAAAESS